METAGQCHYAALPNDESVNDLMYVHCLTCCYCQQYNHLRLRMVLVVPLHRYMFVTAQQYC